MASILKPFGNLLNPKKIIPNGNLAIDWTHPLAQGLLCCYVPGAMGGCDVTGQGPTLVWSSPTNPTMAMGPEGPGSYTNLAGNASLEALATPALKSWTAFSMYMRAFQPAASASTCNPFNITYDNAQGFPYFVAGFQLNSGVTGASGNYYVVSNSGGSPSNGNFAGTTSVGSQYSLGATILVGGNITPYLNGVAGSTTAFGASGPSSTSTSTICLNNIVAGGGRGTNSVIYIACCWNRVLTADEMAWIDLDPYCFLIPAEAEMPALFVSASGPTTPADCSMVFQASANLRHPATLDTNQPRDNMFMGWGKPIPSQLAFWFQPLFLGPTPKSTQNTNQSFNYQPSAPKTPATLWLAPTLDLQRHVPTIYTAQSFVCNPTIGPPLVELAFWNQPPDLLKHPNTLDTNQPKDNIFAGWTNNTPSAFGFWTQPQDLLHHPATIDTNQPASALGQGTLPLPPFPSGALAYYKFDENTGTTINDSVNGYNGTFNGTTGSQWVPGKINSALSFDGSTNFIDLLPWPLLGPYNFSIACWVYVTATGTFGIVGSVSAGGIEFRVVQGAGGGTLELLSEAIVSIGTSNPNVVPLNTWTHVGVSYDSSGNYTFYVNGAPAGSGNNLQTLAAYELQLGLGWFGEYFNGTLDEIGLWGRILSASEFSDLYNSGAGLPFVPGASTPADCSFLFEPTALLNHPQTLDTNQQKDNLFSGWANATPTQLGFWTEAPDLFHHPATIDTRQQFEFTPSIPGVTPADCSFLFQPSESLHHPSTLDTNQPLDDAFFGWAQNLTPTSLGFWTQPPDLLKHPATLDTRQQFEFAPPPGTVTPADCSFLFQPNELLNHPATVNTNQPLDDTFNGRVGATPSALGFWLQAPDLLRHPNTVDTNQSRVSYQDKATPSSLGFWTQAPNILHHPATVDTNQPLDDALVGWTVLTPSQLGFWTQAPDLLRHAVTLDTNQPRDNMFSGWAQNITPTSFGFFTQAPNLLRHANTVDTNQAFAFKPAAPAQTPSDCSFLFEPSALLKHPATLDTNQPISDTFAGWTGTKATPTALGFWRQAPELLRHPSTFILGGQYSFALLPPKIAANAIIKVYFFN